MIEILAPAGNLATFYIAVNSGANAVYLGLKNFSARRGADNFSYEDLKVATDYAHVMGAKVYATLNTLVKEKELSSFLETVIEIRKLGVDAIILQDLFLGRYIARNLPDLELHLSTQGGVNNLEGAVVAKEYGFKRVILARETPVEEIKKIAKIIDTEVFVQGALCTSFSGHCYMSSFGGGNSGNRGLCKQPCRRKYTLNGEENYAVCTADLSLGDKILELEKLGVKSFKIEGRMRRAEYVSAAVSYYRSIIYPHEKKGGERSALKRTFNRGDYTLGLGYGQKNDFLSTKVQGHIGEKVGNVKSVKGNKIYVSGTLNPQKGDGFKILRNGEEVGSADYNGEKAQGVVPLSFKGSVKVGDGVYITTDTRLNQELVSSKGVRIIDVSFIVNSEGTPIVKVLADGKVVASVLGESPFAPSRGKALDRAQIEEIFNKVDAYPFAVEHFEVRLEGDFFAPRSTLNSLRRKAYGQAYDALSFREAPKEAVFESVPFSGGDATKKIAVIAENFKGLEGYDIAIFAPSDYNDAEYFTRFFSSIPKNAEKYLYVPSLLNEADIRLIAKRVEGFDGLYGENPHLFALAKDLNKKIFIGTDFNLFNGISFNIAKENASYLSFSKELTLKEIKSTGYADAGFIFTRGDIKVMELGYCPYGKKCAVCKMPSLNTLTDYAGRKFILRRIKLSKCYFEVYNPMELVFEDGNRNIYNFVLHRDKELTSRFNATAKEYRAKYLTTSGHLKNGVE